MRGDQLARRWRVARAIEASSNGLTVAKFVKRGETGKSTIDRNMENPQTDGSPPPYSKRVDLANRWAFVVYLNSKSLSSFLAPPNRNRLF